MRISVVTAVAWLAVASLSAREIEAASIRRDTNIPAQDLGSALAYLARDRSLQLVYASREVDRLRTSGAVGVLTTSEALTKLLSGTGLTYRYLDEQTVTVLPTASNDGDDVARGERAGAPSVGADQTAATGAGHPAQSPSNPSEIQSLQEVIVTATRRDANLQEVPGTVQALSADTLKALNITNILQLPAVVPGLQIQPTGGNNTYLRGVGSASAGYNETQTAVYIDGLYLPTPAMSIYSFNNIDQVEVLKGPQGTLYGRNATAGLIAVTTRDPDATQRQLDASVGYANYDTWTQNFYGSTPLSDTLAANISVYNSKQNQGWGKNVFTGNDTQKSKETGAQAKLQWRPTSSTKVTTNFIYDTNDRDYGFAFGVLPGTLANDGTPYLGEYRSAARIDTKAPFEAYIGSVKIQQDLGFADLMSLTGYQHSHQRPLFHANTASLGQPVAGQGTVIADWNSANRTWSEELQLTSKPSSSRLDWVTGLYYYNDSAKLALGTYSTCVGSVCAPYVPVVTTGYPTTVSYSGYVDGGYKLFDATRLTAGLRYTYETKGLTGDVVPRAGLPNSVATLPSTTVLYPGQAYTGNPNGIPTESSFDKLTYRVVLSQDFGPDIHAYLSDNFGFKSGAYNATVFTNPPVKPELLHAYEAGVKSELFDRKLRLNLAYFYYDYTDVQMRSTAPPAPPGTALLQNIASERIKGLDGDFTIIPAKGLAINGAFEVLDAKYVNYPGASCSTPGPNNIVNGVLVGTVITVPCNLAGYRVAFAAPFSASLGLTYSLDTAHGRFAFNVTDRYVDRYPLTPDNTIKAPAANTVDASITWTAPDTHYDVQLYGQNLTDTYTYVAGYEAASSFAIVPGAPRVYGVTFGFHY